MSISKAKGLNNLKEIVWDVKDWIHRAEDKNNWRNSYEHGNEPLGTMKCGE